MFTVETSEVNTALIGIILLNFAGNLADFTFQIYIIHLANISHDHTNLYLLKLDVFFCCSSCS